MLRKIGWVPATEITRRFVPLGLAGLPWRGSWPELPSGCTLTRQAAEVRSIAAPFRDADRIEKWITPEYLRWFAASSQRRHEFVGVIDGSGCLTSYVFLAPKKVHGVPAWMEIDHFTCRADLRELLGLIGTLVRDPALLGPERLLSLASFPGDATWDSAPALHSRQEQVAHHFAIPPALRSLPKHTVLAEGDWGF